MGENSTGLTASDVALLNDNNGMNGGWGGMIWLFAILALMGGGFGGFSNGYHPQYATQDFVQNGFNFNDLQDQNRDIMQSINSGTAQTVAATNNVYHDLMNGLSDKYSELQRDIGGLALGQANLLARQNESTGDLKQLISQNNYDAAMRDAMTNANIAAQTQKVLDTLMGNRMEDMQNRINHLELQNALQGVVKYPMGYTYTAGNNPFCGQCM